MLPQEKEDIYSTQSKPVRCVLCLPIEVKYNLKVILKTVTLDAAFGASMKNDILYVQMSALLMGCDIFCSYVHILIKLSTCLLESL